MTPKFSWTQEHRLVVYLLHTEMELETEERVGIFDIVFEQELRSQGLEGIGKGALESQYRERSRQGRENTWGRILAGPSTAKEQNERNQLMVRIRNAKAKLGTSCERLPSSNFADRQRSVTDPTNDSAKLNFRPTFRRHCLCTQVEMASLRRYSRGRP